MIVLLALLALASAQYELTFDRVQRCSDGPKAGAVNLRDVILSYMPSVGSQGIYNCRRERGGRAWSDHADGRAWDVKNNFYMHRIDSKV